MTATLPSDLVEGIDSHVRRIEQIAGETSASQSSLLKQLSELEQALCSVRRGLPSEDFISQLNKLTLLQQRLQSVLERLKVVEARTSRIQAHLSQQGSKAAIG